MNYRMHVCCGCLAIVAILTPIDVEAQQEAASAGVAIPTAMVPADALATVAIHPQEILAAPELKMLPIEIADASMLEHIGVSLLHIDSITGFINTPDPVGVEFGVLIRLTQDLDSGRLNRERFAGPAEQVAGYTAIPLADIPGAYLHRVDPRTFVVATPQYLDAMLGSDGATGPLAALLSERQRRTPIFSAMMLEPVRDEINSVTAPQAANLPPPLVGLMRIPNLSEAIMLESDLVSSGFSRLTIVANHADDASEIAGILDGALQFGKDIAMFQAFQGVNGDGPVADATRSYFQRLGNEITAMLTPEQSGRELFVQLDSLGGGYATSGVLVGLLLPAVQSAREAARRLSSMNNLKQILLAFHNYHDVHRNLPAPIQRSADGDPLLSWRVAILPYIEQGALYDEFHLDEPWDSEHNLKLLDRMPTTYADPSLPLPPGMTVYHVPVGEGWLFSADAPTSFRQITDGLSNTIALFEANADTAVPWTKPADAEIDPDDPLANMAKHRVGGFNVGFADGSVRFITNQIDPTLFKALLTRAGNEVVDIP